ncbi:6,7-dimethyl-8-ribityllumazine synthase [hydrothermal vent metagenome]|uniref:6,7-dimethyl-8-ribityllumazine synthase n=1 Tax=hydrothermal vent metagenome TaxID=652676 RepID=A0A3B0T5V0_9ZZZZ
MTRVLIVEARFYDELADELLAGATAELDGSGTDYDVVSVPGALEIPAVVAMAAKSGRYDGAVALGCVIQGETGHYDIVAGQSARGLMDVAVNKRFAIGNGILTTDTKAQGLARAARNKGNKGRAAVKACLAVIAVKQRLVKSDG